MVVALRRTTLSGNGIEGCSGLHLSPSSDISESVFCIASGLYAKSQFDWEQETPKTHRWVRGTFSLHGRLHSEAQPRLDASGFQSPTMSAPRGAALFPSFSIRHEYTKTAHANNCENQ